MTTFKNLFHSVQQLCLSSTTWYQETVYSSAGRLLDKQLSWGMKELYIVCISTGLYNRQKTFCFYNFWQWWREVLKRGDLTSQCSSSACWYECYSGICRFWYETSTGQGWTTVAVEYFAICKGKVKNRASLLPNAFGDACEFLCVFFEMPGRLLCYLLKIWQDCIRLCNSCFQWNKKCDLTMLAFSGA